MKCDHLRRLGSQANFCLTTPGTLHQSVSSIADVVADLIEDQQKTIERLEREIEKLKNE